MTSAAEGHSQIASSNPGSVSAKVRHCCAAYIIECGTVGHWRLTLAGKTLIICGIRQQAACDGATMQVSSRHPQMQLRLLKHCICSAAAPAVCSCRCQEPFLAHSPRKLPRSHSQLLSIRQAVDAQDAQPCSVSARSCRGHSRVAPPGRPQVELGR